jgi:hypothetical protein
MSSKTGKRLALASLVFGALGLLYTGLAMGTCGGGESASFATTPANGSSLTFTSVGTTRSVVIDNTGSTTITVGTEVIKNGSLFSQTKSCAGANILPGNSCTDEIKCLAKGESEFATSVSGVGQSNIKLKCD